MSLFEVISKIEDIEIIAVGNKIRDLEWLRKNYGSGRWRKLKGGHHLDDYAARSLYKWLLFLE